jgi:hypothetical protein
MVQRSKSNSFMARREDITFPSLNGFARGGDEEKDSQADKALAHLTTGSALMDDGSFHYSLLFPALVRGLIEDGVCPAIHRYCPASIDSIFLPPVSPFVFVVRPFTLSSVLHLFSFPNRDEPAQAPSDPEDTQDEEETASGTFSDEEQGKCKGPYYPRLKESHNHKQREEEEQNNDHEEAQSDQEDDDQEAAPDDEEGAVQEAVEKAKEEAVEGRKPKKAKRLEVNRRERRIRTYRCCGSWLH